jgi:hypothetical protein
MLCCLHLFDTPSRSKKLDSQKKVLPANQEKKEKKTTQG